MNLGRFSIALACCALTVTASAHAQVSGGLFGATRADGSDRDRLNLQASIGEAVDSELPPELRSLVAQNELRAGRRSTTVAASADYARNRRSVQLFGNASTYFRHVHRLDRIAAGSQGAQLGAGVRLPKQGTLTIAQAAAYAPSYLYQLFPTAALASGEAIAVNPEYRIDQTESYSYDTNVALAFGSVRGTRLTTTAEYGLTDFKKQSAMRPNLATQAIGVKISRALSRRAALSIGYEHSTGEFGVAARTRTHRMTMGAEYSPPLSVTRRATFRLQVSPSMFEIPESDAIGRLYPLQGEASVEYPFRLKWRAVASYRRRVDYVPILTEPIFSTGSRVKLTGVIGRRVDVSALAGYATAVSALSRNTRDLRTYTGEVRLRYALTRNFALYSEYLYYFFDLGGQAHLAAGLPSVYEQRGIRVGISLFAQPLGR